MTYNNTTEKQCSDSTKETDLIVEQEPLQDYMVRKGMNKKTYYSFVISKVKNFQF